MARLGNPPIYEDYGSPGFQKYLAALSQKINKLGQTTITDPSSPLVTSSDAPTTTSSNASTVTGTATDSSIAPAFGFVSAAEFNSAITAINTIGTLSNELKSDYNNAVTLINELKTDVNTLTAEIVTLNAALRSAGIIN